MMMGGRDKGRDCAPSFLSGTSSPTSSSCRSPGQRGALWGVGLTEIGANEACTLIPGPATRPSHRPFCPVASLSLSFPIGKEGESRASLSTGPGLAPVPSPFPSC